MPKGYKRKRSFKRKGRRGGYKRSKFGYGPVGGVRGGRFGTTQTIVTNPRIGPDRVFCCFKKTAVLQFSTAAAGAYAVGSLKLNSASDPLGTFGTGPPVGAGSYLGASPALYGAYIVHAFRVKLQIVSPTGFFGAVGMSFRPASMNVPTSIAQQAGFARSTVKQVVQDFVTTITMYGTTGQVYGQSPQSVAIADSFSALYNADPGSEVMCDIGSEENSHTTQITFSAIIELTQYVECFGRNSVA